MQTVDGIVTAVKVGKAVLKRFQTYKDASVDLKRLEGFIAAALFTLDAFEISIRKKLRILQGYEDQILPLVEALQEVFER